MYTRALSYTCTQLTSPPPRWFFKTGMKANSKHSSSRVWLQPDISFVSRVFANPSEAQLPSSFLSETVRLGSWIKTARRVERRGTIHLRSRSPWWYSNNTLMNMDTLHHRRKKPTSLNFFKIFFFKHDVPWMGRGDYLWEGASKL